MSIHLSQSDQLISFKEALYIFRANSLKFIQHVLDNEIFPYAKEKGIGIGFYYFNKKDVDNLNKKYKKL